MSITKRVRIFLNSNPGDGKILAIRYGGTLPEFFAAASASLGVNVTKAFLPNGKEIFDMKQVPDDQRVFLTRGEKYVAADNDADERSYPIYAIAVMGPGAVGKSAITLRYTQGQFVEEYDPTIEDAYRKNTNVDGKSCIVDILDTAGQEDYKALRSSWVRERHGFVLVYSVTDATSLENLKQFWDVIQSSNEANPPPVVVVGNKCDLENERQVKVEQGRKFAASFNNAVHIEASAKTDLNIGVIFDTILKRVKEHVAATAKPARPQQDGCCVLL